MESVVVGVCHRAKTPLGWRGESRAPWNGNYAAPYCDECERRFADDPLAKPYPCRRTHHETHQHAKFRGERAADQILGQLVPPDEFTGWGISSTHVFISCGSCVS